ncbi:NAD-dependent epimerase/dehydratase family protein [Catenulispora subtropica]|uniref:NAD-dependent epimerase/dehydratase family protein n=1 Tax=Catenulispora subtropica TaxID=450798 RepID=A0ABN2QK74_9ACTN
MPFHVIVGAGATALATARLLAEEGDRVRLVSRRGASAGHDLIEPVALDATDADALAALSRGAATVVNCAMPAYNTWPQAVPPLFRAILAAAERSQARYVMLGNLYGYGPVDGPVTEDLPLLATGPKGRVRAQMWQEAAAAHEAGRVRATEVRAGQFLGTGAVSSFTLTVAPNVLAGLLALTPAALDTATGYTAIEDAARALVAVARDEAAFGRAWHAPATNATVREAATVLAKVAGAPAPRLETLTDRDIALLTLTAPIWAEFEETAHMSHQPFLVDSSRIQQRFGLTPTPLDEVFGPLAAVR